MRMFDSRQSVEFQQLFPCKDEPIPNSLPIPCRHLLVPVFSDTELAEVVQSDGRLGPILVSASTAARALLRNPFNLWMVIHLLNSGATLDWISNLQSEVQLLDRYWHFRVDSRSDFLSRRRVLTTLSDKMVKTNTLSVPLRDVTELEIPDSVFKELLSDEILSKTETDRVSFSHNILFDFAVSRLLLDETHIIPFVQEGPARSLFYRPSIAYFMARLWFIDRKSFWTTIEPFFEKSPTMSSISAITPANVIYDAVRAEEDLKPIFELPDAKRGRAIVFVLRSILAFEGLNSSRRRLWQGFLTSALAVMDIAFVNEFLSLTDVGVNRVDVSRDEKRDFANIAVGLLRWLWRLSESSIDASYAQNLSNVAAARLLPAIIQSYALIPVAATEVVQDIEKRFGNMRASANEAFRVASNIEAIIANKPEVAANFFVSVLGFQDTSEQETNIGSAIVPLTSNRAQDFSISHYILEQKFSLLLTTDFRLATRTAVRAITGEVNLKEGNTVAELSAYKGQFQYRGKIARIISDRSDIWDSSYKDYTSLKLLQRVLQALAEKIESDNISVEEIRDVLGEIAAANSYAVTWKRILGFAPRNREFLAAISDLLQVPELLGGPETAFVAGEAIQKGCEEGIYSQEELAKIEGAILSLPESSIASIYRDPLMVRNQLLGCIPEAMLGNEAKKIIQQLREKSGVPPNVPSFKMGPVSYGTPSPEDWLQRQGVQTEQPENRVLLDAVQPLKEFEGRFLNSVPSEADCEAIGDRLRDTYTLLRSSGAADARVVTDILTTVTAVAKEILRCEKLAEDWPIVTNCRAIIFFAAEYLYPPTSKDADASFDRPMWSPTPRIEAAQGIMRYAARWGLDTDTQLLVEKLSRDVSPAVRFQVASSLVLLYEKNREFFWKIANRSLAEEHATGVLVAISRSAAHPHIASSDRRAVLEWESNLLARPLPSQRPEDVLEVIADSLTQLYVYYGDTNASQILQRFERAATEHSFQLGQMALSASHYLARGIDSSGPSDGEVRSRANEILLRVLTAADDTIGRALQQTDSKREHDDAGGKEALTSALKIVDNVVFRLYLVLGVNQRLARDDVRPVVAEPARRNLFFELGPLWKKLTAPLATGNRLLAAQTTHNLMEIFSSCIQYDPAYVLQLAADILKAYNWGYAFDSMAKAEIVKFADVILADHKDVLRDPHNASNLASILNIFVEAGWTEATQLIMKLDGAIR